MLTSSSERGTSPSASASSTLSTSTPTEPTTRPSLNPWPRSALPSCGTGPRWSGGPGAPVDSREPKRANRISSGIPTRCCRVRWRGTRIPVMKGHRPVAWRGGPGALRVAGLYGTRQRQALPPTSPSSGGRLASPTRRAFDHAFREGTRDGISDPCQVGSSMSSSWSVLVRSLSDWVRATTGRCTDGGGATSRFRSRWWCWVHRAAGRHMSGTGPMSSTGRYAPGAFRGRGDPWCPNPQGALKQDLHCAPLAGHGQGPHNATQRVAAPAGAG